MKKIIDRNKWLRKLHKRLSMSPTNKDVMTWKDAGIKSIKEYWANLDKK